ncbi:MAG: hypothetical protein HZRFUVUK_000045 [Candidatus Fervidibacterota bacterium]|jgi:hypothetical protein
MHKHNSETSQRRLKLFFVAIVLVHISLSLVYNFVIPLGYGPDEPHHYGYIQHIVLYRSLPKLGPASHPYLCHRDPRPPNAIGIHPPLYYALLAPFYSLLADRKIDCTLPDASKVPFKLLPYERSKLVQRLLRLFSLLVSVATLWFVWQTSVSVFDENALIVSSVAFVAFLPHYLMISAVMNNDSLTTLTTHAFLYLLVRAFCAPLQPLVGSALLGIVSGLMFLSKASTLSLIPLIPIGAFAYGRNAKTGLARIISFLLPLFLPAVISGWWYLRFYVLYGRLMPIVKWTYEPYMLLNSPLDFLTDARSWALLWRFIKGAHRSIWAQVDWFIFKQEHGMRWSQFYGSINSAFYPYSEAVYLLLVLLTIAVLFGLLVRFAQWVRNIDWSEAYSARLILSTAFLLFYLALMHYTLFTHPGGYEGGRYLLPTIYPFSVIWWSGICGLVGKKHLSALAVCFIALLLLLNLLCIGNLVYFLNPLYAPSF